MRTPSRTVLLAILGTFVALAACPKTSAPPDGSGSSDQDPDSVVIHALGAPIDDGTWGIWKHGGADTKPVQVGYAVKTEGKSVEFICVLPGHSLPFTPGGEGHELEFRWHEAAPAVAQGDKNADVVSQYFASMQLNCEAGLRAFNSVRVKMNKDTCRSAAALHTDLVVAGGAYEVRMLTSNEGGESKHVASLLSSYGTSTKGQELIVAKESDHVPFPRTFFLRAFNAGGKTGFHCDPDANDGEYFDDVEDILDENLDANGVDHEYFILRKEEL